MRALLLILLFATNAIAANLLENSSFETGDLRGWAHGGGTYPAFEPLGPTNSGAYYGSNVMRLEYCSTNGGNVIETRPYKLKPNTAYTFTAWAKADADTAHADVLWLNVLNAATTAGDAQTNFTITGEWARYTNVFTTLATNDESSWYVFRVAPHWAFANADQYDGEWLSVDALQLEEATQATDYAPLSVVEVGAQANRSIAGHVFYTNDTLALPFVAWNDSASSSNVTVNYEVRNFWNKLAVSNAFTITVGGYSHTTNNLSPAVTNTGWFRLLYWVPGAESSAGEVQFSRVPNPVTLASRTNSFFGGTLTEKPWTLAQAQRLGTHWSRDFSVENHGRWLLAEPTEGNFVLNTNALALLRTYDIEPLLNIGEHASIERNGVYVPDIPTWATNSVDFWPDNTKWSNFVFKIVDTYKPYVTYYEVFNEMTDGQITNVWSFAKGAMASADATAIMVAPADYYANTISNLLTVSGTNSFDVWSTHTYAPTADNVKWAGDTMNYWGKRGFNSEIGLRTEPSLKSIAWEQTQVGQGGDPDGNGYSRDARVRVQQILKYTALCFQDPIDALFYYEGRTTSGYLDPITFSTVDFDLMARPMGVMFAIAAQFMENGQRMGRLTTVDDIASGVWWSRDGVGMACLWPTNIDSAPEILGDDGATGAYGSNRKLAIYSTQTIKAYDLMGNDLNWTNGMPFGYDPIYIVAGDGVGTNDFISGLSVSNAADTVAPNVRVVNWPTTRATNYTFRWSAVDDSSLDLRWNGSRWASNAVNTNALKYAYRVGSGDWSEYQNKSWATVDTTEATTFSVAAIDAAGNATTNTVNITAAEESPETPETPAQSGTATATRIYVGTLRRQ